MSAVLGLCEDVKRPHNKLMELVRREVVDFIVNYAKRHKLTCFTTNSFLLRHAKLATVLCEARRTM
jgi:hypothetical protein